MKIMKINGGNTLSGTINISGAKNSAVALVPASLLCDEQVVLYNVPNISDVDALEEILEFLNAEITKDGNSLYIDSKNIINMDISKDHSKKLRASYYFMSALLGKFGKVSMYFPGGCNIGARPIDLTLNAYKALGATVVEENDQFSISADKLVGANIHLNFPSVGATINTILVAVKAEGTTIIENAAKEPEIGNIIDYLNNMGAKITGKDTSTITIEGVTYLHKAEITVIPDRIEAGTYLIAGALIGDNLKINNLIPEHIKSLTDKFSCMGVDFIINKDNIIINKSKDLNPVNITTLGYPGFPTDLQQPITVLLTQCNGESIIEETIYENRMGHVPYLNKMGANIISSTNIANIYGCADLVGTETVATDLRAGAAMVMAGLFANGETIVNDAEHILRGYENIIEKLTSVGASISIDEI